MSLFKLVNSAVPLEKPSVFSPVKAHMVVIDSFFSLWDSVSSLEQILYKILEEIIKGPNNNTGQLV